MRKGWSNAAGNRRHETGSPSAGRVAASGTPERMNIVITGHVDHGKSTLVGRLLTDTRSLPEGKLEAVRNACEKNGRVFEYSMLLDALEDEQKQGITIDSARVFFKSARREYIMIDAPGHVEFLRNMLSGASRAVAAVLVIDAVEGVAENSRRHGLLLSLLGISQVVVVINKLDLYRYDETVFHAIRQEYERYLESLDVKPVAFIPVSAREGKNIVTPAPETPWYRGKTVLEILDGFNNPVPEEDAFFAMPLQDVYRFSNDNDERRIYAGTVVSGRVAVGDRVRFLPSGREARIASIEAWSAPVKTVAKMHESTGFTLVEDIYAKSGEVLVKVDENAPVQTASRLQANMIWLSGNPLTFGKSYLLKLGAAKVEARLEKIERVLGDARDDMADSSPCALNRNACGSVILRLARPIALTSFHENASLGRFVLVDDHDAAGGGIVLAPLPEEAARPALPEGFEDTLFLLLRKYFPHRFPDTGKRPDPESSSSI
ncbi:MAG: 50S ribosome-binding GTPase [Zoogloeaceae bacterium]|jgi:bifunctional enzyme CysN/CysC/sulfate adenylyltransferase subunit 1|nr:50S ribosome-binding GTPase [Zoogloeaceae bacterium]